MYHGHGHRQHPANQGFTPLGGERLNEILEQVKNDYATFESEYSLCKMQRDDYERKLESQLNEFQSMRQQIQELDITFQNTKNRYEEQIHNLKQTIDKLQAQLAQTQGHTPIHDTRTDATPSPVQQFRPRPPLSKPEDDQGYDYPPGMGGAPQRFPPISSQSDNIKPNYPSIGNVPSFDNLTDNRPPRSDDVSPKPPHQPGRDFGRDGPSNQPQRQQPQRMSNTINNLTGPLMDEGAPPQVFPRQQMPVNALAPTNGAKVPSDTMVKREGNDWVVVYNPQVKLNVSINLLHNLDHQQSVVCCVKFSSDGKYLATGSNNMAQIFDVDTGKRVTYFPADGVLDKQNDMEEDREREEKESNRDGEDENMSNSDKEDSYVRSVCFSPDGKYLVAGAEDKTVKVWDINSHELKYSLVGHELDIYSLDFSYDSRFVVSGSGDGKAKIWNMESGLCEHTLGNEEIGPKEGVTSVAISPDGRVVAAGSLDCVVRLWDAHTGKFLDSFKGHDDSVYSVAFSPDGKTLASGSLDRTLKLWDLTGGGSTSANLNNGGGANSKCIATLSGHRDYVLSVAFSTEGRWLISGSKDRSVQFWDPRSNVLHLMLQGHKNSVISVALNPNPTKHMFATGSGDFRARIWGVTDTTA